MGGVVIRGAAGNAGGGHCTAGTRRKLIYYKRYGLPVSRFALPVMVPRPAAGISNRRGNGERCIVFFYNKVFREEAVARRSRPEPLDDRLQVTAPHEWMVLAGLALSLLAFLAWGVFGSVDRRLSARAVLVQPGERHAVVSPVSGNVIEVLADVGDPLEAGQAIARVRLPEAERQARITRRIADAVEDRVWRVEGAAPLQEALLAAARNALGEVEILAGETIAAPHGGELVAHRLVPGQPVRAGETIAQLRGGAEGAWQALAFVSSQDAGKLAAGMAAEVQVALPGQPDSSTLDARVLEVSPRPAAAPEWLADLGLSTPAPSHLLRLALDDPSRLPLADGAGGVVRIVLGRQSPAALLLAGRGV